VAYLGFSFLSTKKGTFLYSPSKITTLHRAGWGFQRLLNFHTVQPGAPEKIYIFFCHTRILKKISENKKQCETLIKHRDFEKNAVKMRSNEKSAPF